MAVNEDIRRFFKRPCDTGVSDEQTSKKGRCDHQEVTQVAGSAGGLYTESVPSIEEHTEKGAVEEQTDTPQTGFAETDIGQYIRSERVDDSVKVRLLTEPYMPPQNYNFKADSTDKKRTFRYSWLSQYSPWLAYSPLLKGPLCLTCVLFPQSVHRGLQGSFIASPCTKYHAFNECARNHMQSSWHKASTEDAANFRRTRQKPETAIIPQLDAAVAKQIAENRKKTGTDFVNHH